MTIDESHKVPLLTTSSLDHDNDTTISDFEKAKISPSSEQYGSNGFLYDIFVSMPERPIASLKPTEQPSINNNNVDTSPLEDGSGRMDGDYSQMQKAFELAPFNNILVVNKASPVNPFVNKTPTIVGCYEVLKTILLSPVALVRLVFIALISIVGMSLTRVSMAGRDPRSDDAEALGQWRWGVMKCARLCARAFLFFCGFQWIQRKGKLAPKKVAPIIVSNHTSFIDGIFYYVELFPFLVSSISNHSMPLAGTIISSVPVILVDRSAPESRKKAKFEIMNKATRLDLPHVLLFPEGTTTNGRALMSFKMGAFTPGLPIQPVVLRYPFVHFDISWGDIGLLGLMLRMLTQFHNFFEVEYLPVIYPSPREQANPAEFAERVRFEMARALCIPTTEHTHGDLAIVKQARQFNMSSPTSFMVEMGRLEKLLHLRSGDVKQFLEKFSLMDPAHSGTVSMDQFLEWHHLPRCWISEKIFRLFDKLDKGVMNFHEFVAVSGSISKHEEFESLLRLAYNACNSKGNDSMSFGELAQCLKLSMPSISSAEIANWFEKLDLDGDGAITWKDFQTFMELNSELLGIFMVSTVAPSPLS